MKIEKRPITLLEIMIVIVIIGLIGGVTGYAMKGSLDSGKSFKSEQGSKQVHDLLALEVARGRVDVEAFTNFDAVLKSLKETGLIDNPAKLAKDGWGEPFVVVATPGEEDGFIVTSARWERYLEKKNKTKEEMAEEYPWAFRAVEE